MRYTECTDDTVLTMHNTTYCGSLNAHFNINLHQTEMNVLNIEVSRSQLKEVTE